MTSPTDTTTSAHEASASDAERDATSGHAVIERSGPDDGIVTLRIAQAGKLNILGTPVISDLRLAVERLAADASVRVLVLRGTGDRALVGGADIGEMAALTRPAAERFIDGLRGLCEAVRRFPTPVIARMSGWCLGGGLELAMACDIRIASDDAHFGMPEVKVGIPSVIHAALMPRLVGQSRAAWMLLTGESIDASQALTWGLVHQVVPLAELDAEIERLSTSLVGMGSAVLRQQKRLLRQWEDTPLDAAIAATVPEFGRAFDTPEPRRFMNEFLERKRAGRTVSDNAAEAAKEPGTGT